MQTAKPKDPLLKALKERQQTARDRRDGITIPDLLHVQEGFAKAERDSEAIRNRPVEHKTMAERWPEVFKTREQGQKPTT